MAQPANADVLRDIEDLLNAHGVSLASFVIGTLRDSESSLAKDLIAKITDVLEALRPNLDGSSVAELGRFLCP